MKGLGINDYTQTRGVTGWVVFPLGTFPAEEIEDEMASERIQCAHES